MFNAEESSSADSNASSGDGPVRRPVRKSLRAMPYGLYQRRITVLAGISSRDGRHPQQQHPCHAIYLGAALKLAAQSMNDTLKALTAACEAPPKSPAATDALQVAEAAMSRTLRRIQLAVQMAGITVWAHGPPCEGEFIHGHMLAYNAPGAMPCCMCSSAFCGASDEEEEVSSSLAVSLCS